MKNRIIVLLLAVCIILPFSVQAAPASVCSDNYTPVARQSLNSILYGITDCKGHESVILGTLHSSDAEIIATVRPALNYLKQANTAWFEIVQDAANQATAARFMFLPASEKGLKERIGETYFTTLVQHFTRFMPEVPKEYLDRYRPWAAAIALQMLTIDTKGVVMDDWLQAQAKHTKRDIKGLETIEKQFSVFNTFSNEEEITMLKDAVDSFEENLAISDKLVTAYKQGNLQTIYNLSEEMFVAMSDQTLSQKLKNELMIKRNATMANALIPHLSKGNQFIAVGALHLPHETGLLQSFENAGYRIYPLTK